MCIEGYVGMEEDVQGFGRRDFTRLEKKGLGFRVQNPPGPQIANDYYYIKR